MHGPSADASAALFDLIVSQRVTATIVAAARLGVPDLMTEGTRTVAALADRTGAQEAALRRLLRALVAIGLCRQVGDDEFDLTALGWQLAGNVAGSLKAWALFEGEMVLRAWAGLLDSIRTGKPAAELAGFESGFDLIADNPRLVTMFNEAMAAFTGALIPLVLEAYDFSGIAKLIDIGGGYGQLLCAILDAYPQMRGVVFDLPRCAEGARRQLAQARVGERGEFVAGSFFDGVPRGADALLLKSVIHDWDDERSLRILVNCRRAVAEPGRLVLIERLMPELPGIGPNDRDAVLSDLNMLRSTGGRERTEREYGDLLMKAGFRVARIVPARRLNVIEAAPA